ncbi:MAG: hypothetical protein ACXAEU_11450 [Candidatus Hodarchaeales archaeon]|jgi:DNA-directed RNA polymerase subunit F
MSKRILNEKSVTLEKVKELLLERDEEHAPLNYIQRVTLDYAFRFSKEIPKAEQLIDILTNEISTNEETRKFLVREFTNDEEEEVRESRTQEGEEGAEKKRKEIVLNHAREKAIQLVTIDPEEPDDIVLVMGDLLSGKLTIQIFDMIRKHKEEFQDTVAAKTEEVASSVSDQGNDMEFEGFIDDEE